MPLADPRPARRSHRRPGRAQVTAACALLALSLASLTGCAARPKAEVPLPAFPASAAPEPVARILYDGLPSCDALLPVAELEAVLGLPLDEVAVTDVRDVPAPSVGRLQRTTCTYAGTDATGPVRGVVLELTAGRYGDAAAARAQRDRNAAARADGPGRPVVLGAALGSEHAPDGGAELLLAHGGFTLELLLPAGVADRRGGADVLTDLALRALARLPVEGPGHPG